MVLQLSGGHEGGLARYVQSVQEKKKEESAMRIFLEVLGKDGMPEDHEMLVENLLWVKLELSGGPVIRLDEVDEEGSSLSVNCANGRLMVEPRAVNAIVIEVLDY